MLLWREFLESGACSVERGPVGECGLSKRFESLLGSVFFPRVVVHDLFVDVLYVFVFHPLLKDGCESSWVAVVHVVSFDFFLQQYFPVDSSSAGFSDVSFHVDGFAKPGHGRLRAVWADDRERLGVGDGVDVGDALSVLYEFVFPVTFVVECSESFKDFLLQLV